MKKKLFLVFLILFQFVGFTQTGRSPYPIIFVHGIDSDNNTWDQITNYLYDWYGPVQVVNMVLNANTGSTHYLNDVRIDFSDVAPLSNGNIFTVNFKNWWNENPNDPKLLIKQQHSHGGESQSNESAIFKQGYALKLIIEKVLIATHSDGVILVGHSMGGLAIREYLQRKDSSNLPMWWINRLEADGHRVKKVFTLNTPHLGSNFGEVKNSIMFPNPSSEATRDLRYSYDGLISNYPGVYLFGGNEGMISEHSSFHNYDVNCDGDSSDKIIGISNGTSYNPILPLPTNIYYTWGTSTGDWIVSTDKMWLYNQNMTPQPLGADTLLTTDGHLDATENVRNLIRGLDEPNTKELAYDLTPKNMSFFKIDRTFKGFITYQPAPASFLVDNDFYKVVLPAPGDLKVSLSGDSSGIQQIAVISDNNFVANNNMPGELTLQVTADTHYIRLRGYADEKSWRNPYTLNVKYDIGAPPQVPTNLLPLNGAIFEHQNMSVVWSDVDRAKTYEFQLAKDTLFSNLVYSQTGLTSSTIDVSNLELEKKYYWRVRSANYWGVSDWSDVWSFTTEDALAVGKVNSKPSGGNWGDPKTWIDGKVPSENEDVVIRGQVNVENDHYCRALVVVSEGSVQSGSQSNSILHMSGNLINYGKIKNNSKGYSLSVQAKGHVANFNEITASSLVMNGSSNQVISLGNGNSFDCNVSFLNSGGDLVAGSPLVFNKGVSLGGGKLQIGEYPTTITQSGTVFGGQIVGEYLIYNGSERMNNMMLNVRNLFMSGGITNCTFQGPVTFHGRIMSVQSNTVNGDLTIIDTLESLNHSAGEHLLQVNGNLVNNGIIQDRLNSQSALRIDINGNFENNGEVSNYIIQSSGSITNNNTLNSSYLSLDGTTDQYLILAPGKDFPGNISFTNASGRLIAGSDLRFTGTVNLTTGKFITGDYSVTGGYIIGGKFDQPVFRFYGEGTLRDAQLNVRNLFVYGDLLNCTLQGPVTFHNRIRSNVYNLINGDLIIQDTLENVNAYSSYGHTLEVNGNLINNGLITENSAFNQGLRLITSGDITNQGWMRNSFYTLTGSRNRTINVGDNTSSIFSSDGDSVVLTGQNRLPNLSVIAGSCILHENSELVIYGNMIQGNFKNFGKVIVERHNYNAIAVYDFFMSRIKLEIQPNFNKLTVANFGYQTPTLFGTAIKSYWSVSTEPSSYFDAQFLNFEYKDDMLNGNDESRLEVFHSNNGQNNWQKVSSPSNISRNPEMNSVQISNIPIQGYFTLASSANFPEIVVLSLPQNDQPNEPVPVKLVWRKANMAGRYMLSVAKDSLFSQIVVADSNLTDTVRILSNMDYNSSYYWRVKAGNQLGWGDWSDTWRFTTIIEKPVIPVLANPLNNALGVFNPITAKWNKALRAEKYHLQVSTDNTFASLIVNDSTISDTNEVLPNLSNYTKYYWRVKAVNIGGISDWSTVWNFKTLGNPYASIPVQPTDLAVNQPLNGLTFKWTKAKERIETISKYQFQLSTDSLFASFVVNDTTLTDTSKIVNGLSYLTKYFWRVRANNETGWGDWSSVSRFTSIIEKPTVPMLASPANNSLGLLNPVTTKWNKSLRVEKYHLQVSTDNAFASLIVNDSTITDTNKVLPALSNYTKYYWRVKAVNIGGISDWSTIWNFKTLGNPYASNLYEPLNNSLNLPLNGVTFKWSKAKERIETVSKYQFQVSTDSLFATLFVNDTTLTDTSRMVNGMGYLTKYFWRVRAQNETGWGDWSVVSRFTTIIEKPVIPVLATPLNNALGLLNPIVAKWNKSLRVEKYHLQVSTDNLFTALVVNDSLVTDTNKVLPTLSNYTKYYWRVKAVNIGGISDWSTVWNFKTLGNPYASIPVQPTDLAVNQPLNGLTFKWTKAKERIETISKYQFQLSTDSLFGSFVVNDTTLTDTSRIVNGLSYLTKYFWRVRANNETGWGDWSSVSRFTSIIEKPTVPMLASPANNSLGLLNPVTTKWNKSLRVEKYHLQVSTDNAFASLIVNDSTITDTNKVLPALSNYTKYYWRVKAVNIGGISDWSTVWNFKTLGNPYASNPLQPIDQAVNQPINGLTFKWSKAKDRIETIQKYQFQVSTDSLFAASFINDTTLTDTLRIVDGLSYLTKYFWRVRAQNETGLGDWSEVWHLTTIIEKPAVPVLASPANNATQQLQPVVLKWRQSLRATGYTLEVSEDPAFASLTIVDSTLTDTVRTLPQLDAPKPYYWRVKARNIGGVSEFSQAWNFRTLGLPLTVTLVSPLNAAVNQPVNNLLFVWSNGGEQTLRPAASVGEPLDKPAFRNISTKEGQKAKTSRNQALPTSGSLTGSLETIGKYWLEITSDTTGATFFLSDSTITDTTKSVSGFAYLTGHYWRVKAQNETGWGNFTGWSGFTTIIERPGIAVLVSPQDQSTGNIQPVTVKWRTALRAERYTLEVSLNSGFTSIVVRDTNLTDTSRVLPALLPLQEYYWRVYSTNTGGVSDTSAVWRFKTLGIPTAVSLVYPANNSVNIPVDLTFTWTRATDQETILGYWFELASDTAVGVIIRDTLLTDTLKAVTGLANNTSFYWRVKAQNETGWGNFTAWSTFKTVKKLIAPPTNLVATAVAVGQVSLNWTDNSDNETGFVIARKSGDSTSLDPLVILDTVSAGVTQYLDSLVSDTTLYSYLVAAYNNDTISPPSNYAQVFTLTGIKELFAAQLPETFDLYQNYPNPFNPSTMIRFAIPKEANVRIELFSTKGELITVLMSENMSAGYYETRLEIPNYASGIYLYRIVAQPVDGSQTFTNTKKLILVK